MKTYFAPLEGITGYIYRNAFHDVIEDKEKKIEKYFTPFISPGVNQPLSRKELRDVLPENNEGVPLVPQILGNNANDICIALDMIKDLGYKEMNLNLGCPSGTVVAKRKGSGLLAYLDELDAMLEGVYDFAAKNNLEISVKTRVGKDSYEELYEIMDIYNRYPISELIIHPRVQKDFYKNTPNMESFRYAYTNSKNSVIYNGDVCSIDNYIKIKEDYPNIEGIMIGRGFLRNPLLVDKISNLELQVISNDVNLDLKKIKRFHNRLVDDYTVEMSGEKPVLFKMKELWTYMGEDLGISAKDLKNIRKCESLAKYKNIVTQLMSGIDG